MITVQTESLEDFIEEVKPLAEECLGEISSFGLPAKPDYQTYLHMTRQGMVHAVTARNDGELVGYYLFIVHTHPHHGVLMAAGDSFFIKPKYRGGITAIRILDESERSLTEMGVEVMTINMKVESPFDSIALRQGFESIERVYGKRLSKK